MIRSATVLAPTMLALIACDARSDGNYAGDPLFSLTGTVENQLSSTPEDVQLFLVWQGLEEKPAAVVPLDVHPTFPARFRLDVLEPPDVFGREDEDLPHLINASGNVIAARPGTEFHTDVYWRDEPGVLGGDPRHFLYYLREDLVDPVSTAIFHGPLTAGFHLMDIKCLTPEHRQQIRDCIATFPTPHPDNGPIWDKCGLANADLNWQQVAPADLATQLTVELMDDVPGWEPDPSECF